MHRFASHLTDDPRKRELARSAERIDDIQAVASESFAKYADERKFPGVRKWLQRAISKMHHYANIMDVFVQHHPEYVALAWGAMKLVLVVSWPPQPARGDVGLTRTRPHRTMRTPSVSCPRPSPKSQTPSLVSSSPALSTRRSAWCEP